jgi:hypothetical protein
MIVPDLLQKNWSQAWGLPVVPCPGKVLEERRESLFQKPHNPAMNKARFPNRIPISKISTPTPELFHRV